MNDKDKRLAIEQEITKQIDQMDEKFDRSGWFYLLLLVALVFVVTAGFMYFSNSEPDVKGSTIEEMAEHIQSLEKRIESLENLVKE